MIRKAHLLFCDNEHGTGDVVFPDLTRLEGFEIQQYFVGENSKRDVRKQAHEAGWRRFGGVDYCPVCVAAMREGQE